jgi:ketosteroid isomerase-like protein
VGAILGLVDEPAERAIRGWFEALQRCVAAVDYATARPLFVDDAIGFGTKAHLAVGRETLEASQWSGIWPSIRDFRFNLDQLRSGADGDLGWGIVTWDSTGFDERGEPYERPGRATVIFVRRDGAWRALHTHFSLFPGTPPRTFGPLGQNGGRR